MISAGRFWQHIWTSSGASSDTSRITPPSGHNRSDIPQHETAGGSGTSESPHETGLSWTHATVHVLRQVSKAHRLGIMGIRGSDLRGLRVCPRARNASQDFCELVQKE